jgi:2-amino-4-hydroxy-6-hydroxymethyldihydropteridine diphosphokinase
MSGEHGGTARSAFIGLGTNLGDRADNLRRAVRGVREFGTVTGVSDVYESDAVGYTEQPRFWNMAVRIDTHLEPLALLRALKRLEREQGRVETFRMGPRVIDLDILLCDDVVMNDVAVEIPHPRMMERAFVLRPLLDLDPLLVHPATGEALAARLAADHGDDTLTRIGSIDDVR